MSGVGGMGMGMKRLLLCLFSLTSLHAQDNVIVEQAPPQVVASAVKAVADLGKEVASGRYKVAVDRMYPQWKDRAAKRAGGMEALEKQLDGVAAQMLQRGISIMESAPQGLPRVFEVSPGKKVDVEGGKQIERLRYTKWMVLVPTVTKFRMFLENDPVAVMIESTGFQVAISEKGKNDWTFIDGASVGISDLRSLFGNLPQDLELPPLEKKQIR